jgi:hypothetical protein
VTRYGFEPDFDNLRTVLKGGRGYRVPNYVAADHRITGRERILDMEVACGRIFVGL